MDIDWSGWRVRCEGGTQMTAQTLMDHIQKVSSQYGQIDEIRIGTSCWAEIEKDMSARRGFALSNTAPYFYGILVTIFAGGPTILKTGNRMHVLPNCSCNVVVGPSQPLTPRRGYQPSTNPCACGTCYDCRWEEKRKELNKAAVVEEPAPKPIKWREFL